MQPLRTQLNQINPFAHATIFSLVVFLTIPILLFSTYFPEWLPILVTGLLLVVFWLRALANGRLLGHTPADFPLYILLLLIPLNLWATPDLIVTLPLIYALIANIALFWAIAAQQNAKWLPYTPWLYILASLGLIALTLIGTNFNATKSEIIPAAVYNLLPTVNILSFDPDGFNPNLSAGLLALFVIPLFVTVWRGKGWFLRSASALPLMMSIVLILLMFSRGAVMGMAVALIIITLLTNKRWLIFWLAAGIASAIALYFLAPLFDLETVFIGAADASTAQYSLASRQEIWSRIFYMLQDFPFTGVGLGMVKPVIQILYPTFLMASENVNHAHNIYLQAGAEMGLLAMVALIAFLLVLGVVLLRRYSAAKNSPIALLALGLFGSLIVFMVHGLIDTITSSPLVAIIVWGLFGLMAAIAGTTPRPDQIPTIPS